jgi:hypothetical protein
MFCSSCQNVTKLVLYWLGSWNMYAPRFESYRLITGARIFLDMYSFNGSNVLILIASTYGDIVHFFMMSWCGLSLAFIGVRVWCGLLMSMCLLLFKRNGIIGARNDYTIHDWQGMLV